jgi:hypothetical protein
MHRAGTIWTAYPNDSPGPIDFDSPVGKPFWVEKFVWRNATDTRITPGSVCHITDADGNEVFNRVWPEDDGATNEITFEPRTYFRGMRFEAFDQGVLDIVNML